MKNLEKVKMVLSTIKNIGLDIEKKIVKKLEQIGYYNITY